MSKKRDLDYVMVCALCENATVLKGGNGILCRQKGIVSEDYSCRKFVYDPLKRAPKLPRQIPTLSKDDIL